jgi:tRNA(Ser,Leu) C12 N-acetylase TAN1
MSLEIDTEEIAKQIKEVASQSQTEEDLRVRVENILKNPNSHQIHSSSDIC